MNIKTTEEIWSEIICLKNNNLSNKEIKDYSIKLDKQWVAVEDEISELDTDRANLQALQRQYPDNKFIPHCINRITMRINKLKGGEDE